MIRPMREEDSEAIIAMVQTGDMISRDDATHMLHHSTGAMVYDDGQIKGLGIGSESQSGSADLKLYTHPHFRRQGIGSQMWDAMRSTFSDGVKLITTHYRIDLGDPGEFYCAHGFKRWYQMHQMEYYGGRLPEPEFMVRPYSDDQFEGYAALINEGFARLREIGDFRPYRIYPEDARLDQALRERVLKSHADCAYLFYKEGELVGVAEIDDGKIETVAVAPAWRGKGCGRQIVNYSINRLLERGADHVSLYVLSYNQSALALYESMGFRIVQTLEYARWQHQDGLTASVAADR